MNPRDLLRLLFPERQSVPRGRAPDSPEWYHGANLLYRAEASLSDIAAQWPAVDLQHLRQLRRNAIKEQEQNKPPKNFRAIFQVLQELDQQGATHDAE